MHDAGDSIFFKEIPEDQQQDGDHVVFDDVTGAKIILRVVAYEEARQILENGDNISAAWKDSQLGKAILEK
jgi:hypothetical protein